LKKHPLKNHKPYQAITSYEQKKENVQKDLWIYKDNKRLQVRVQSPVSWMQIQKLGKKWYLQENFQKFDLWLQDHKDITGQNIQYFKAGNGTYYYTNQKFIAEKLHVEFFKLEGLDLPLKISSYSPYLIGKAEKIDLSIKGKLPQLKMEGFHSQIILQ
jgi:hypothetical protein